MAKKAVGNDSAPPVKLGDGGFTDWVIVALYGLREYLDHPYRRLLDVLHEMPGIVEELGLSPADLPDFTTVCARKQDLEMAVWRVLLRLSAALHDFGEVQAIDSTSYAYRSSSRNYAKRVEDTFESVKITSLVDCSRGAILDVHCSMNLPHDTQVGWQVLTRNLDQLETVAADKAFDWDELRHKLREAGVRPVIKHRELSRHCSSLSGSDSARPSAPEPGSASPERSSSSWPSGTSNSPSATQLHEITRLNTAQGAYLVLTSPL